VSLVVAQAASGIAQELIGVGDRLELVRRGRVPAAQVRMRTAGELAVGADDLLPGCVRRHAEHPVGVSGAGLSRHHDRLPRPGRYLIEIQ
jgi:hypothetical protein